MVCVADAVAVAVAGRCVCSSLTVFVRLTGRYKKQQQELNELKESLNSDLRVDVMKRNSAALKAAIAQETQRWGGQPFSVLTLVDVVVAASSYGNNAHTWSGRCFVLKGWKMRPSH